MGCHPPGEMSQLVAYEKVVEDAFKDTCTAYESGKFSPQLEEDVQCYMYHACLTRLRDATEIHAKISRGAKTVKGDWIFPDLSLGKDEVVVEIKFIGKNFNSQQATRVRRSAIESMKVMSHHSWYKERRRLLACFDERRFLWEYNRKEIRESGPEVRTLFYPQKPPGPST